MRGMKNIPMHVCKIWVSGLASAANLCITCLSLRVPEYHSKIIGFTCRLHGLPSITHIKFISLVVAFQNYRFYLQDSQVAEHYPQQTYSLVVTVQNYRFYLQDSQVAEYYPQKSHTLDVAFQNYRFYLQDTQIAKHYPQQTYSSCCIPKL